MGVDEDDNDDILKAIQSKFPSSHSSPVVHHGPETTYVPTAVHVPVVQVF